MIASSPLIGSSYHDHRSWLRLSVKLSPATFTRANKTAGWRLLGFDYC